MPTGSIAIAPITQMLTLKLAPWLQAQLNQYLLCLAKTTIWCLLPWNIYIFHFISRSCKCTFKKSSKFSVCDSDSFSIYSVPGWHHWKDLHDMPVVSFALNVSGSVDGVQTVQYSQVNVSMHIDLWLNLMLKTWQSISSPGAWCVNSANNTM